MTGLPSLQPRPQEQGCCRNRCCTLRKAPFLHIQWFSYFDSYATTTCSHSLWAKLLLRQRWAPYMPRTLPSAPCEICNSRPAILPLNCTAHDGWHAAPAQVQLMTACATLGRILATNGMLTVLCLLSSTALCHARLSANYSRRLRGSALFVCRHPVELSAVLPQQQRLRRHTIIITHM